MSSPEACPRCSQGTVAPHTIAATAERIWLCDECEAVWLEDEPVTADAFQTFGNVMADRGLSDRWMELLSE